MFWLGLFLGLVIGISITIISYHLDWKKYYERKL